MGKRLIKVGLVAVAIVLVASLASFVPVKVTVTGEGNLSLEADVALAVGNPPDSEFTEQSYTVSSVGQPIDWSEFWQTYKQYALWGLEWFNGFEWVSVKEDLTIQRSYPVPNECKVNLVFDASHAGNYRLTHAINRVVSEHIARTGKYQYDLTYDDIEITFDWSDCAKIPGLVFRHGVKNGYFWFRIRRDNVPLGAHVEIDPATVGTSAAYHTVDYAYMRKSFYAAGLFWVFYTNAGNAGWECSDDGTTWTGDFTVIGAVAQGYKFSVWFDGTYVHYVTYRSSSLYYRRGTPNNDGTITWAAVEQTVYSGSSGDEYKYPCISVDSNGYAWIGAYYDKPNEYDLPIVLKNANNDGTWTTDFTYELSAVDDTKWKVCPVPLTDGKVYVIYARSSQLPLGQPWDEGWGAEENDLADFNIEDGYGFSPVAEGDNIHFVYNQDAPYQFRYNKRTYGVGWGADDVLVQSAVSSTSAPALSLDTATGDLYCFWTRRPTDDHVFYKKYSSGSWDVDPTDWIDETVDEIKYDYLITSFLHDYGGYIGLLYTTKLTSPYNVKFAFLTVGVEPEISNTPDSKGFGNVFESSSYWSNGSAPTWPLDDGECYFTVTNNGDTCSITIKATNFTGGDGWTLTSGSPGSGTVRLRAGKSGDANEGVMVILTIEEQAFIAGLVTSKKWELKLETGTFTDGVLKTSIATLTATLD